MTLFCFSWHCFRGHRTHTLQSHHVHLHSTPFVVTQKKMEACTSTLVAGAPTRFLRLQCSRSLVIVYTVTLDWLAAEQFCQNSERSYRLYSVQCTVYRCTVQFIIGVQVDTWSLLHCTGMRSGHYGFECKHRQGFLCMFIYRRIGRIRISDPQFWHWYCDDYKTSKKCLHLLHQFQKLSGN